VKNSVLTELRKLIQYQILLMEQASESQLPEIRIDREEVTESPTQAIPAGTFRLRVIPPAGQHFAADSPVRGQIKITGYLNEREIDPGRSGQSAPEITDIDATSSDLEAGLVINQPSFFRRRREGDEFEEIYYTPGEFAGTWAPIVLEDKPEITIQGNLSFAQCDEAGTQCVVVGIQFTGRLNAYEYGSQKLSVEPYVAPEAPARVEEFDLPAGNKKFVIFTDPSICPPCQWLEENLGELAELADKVSPGSRMGQQLYAKVVNHDDSWNGIPKMAAREGDQLRLVALGAPNILEYLTRISRGESGLTQEALLSNIRNQLNQTFNGVRDEIKSSLESGPMKDRIINFIINLENIKAQIGHRPLAGQKIAVGRVYDESILPDLNSLFDQITVSVSADCPTHPHSGEEGEHAAAAMYVHRNKEIVFCIDESDPESLLSSARHIAQHEIIHAYDRMLVTALEDIISGQETSMSTLQSDLLSQIFQTSGEVITSETPWEHRPAEQFDAIKEMQFSLGRMITADDVSVWCNGGSVVAQDGSRVKMNQQISDELKASLCSNPARAAELMNRLAARETAPKTIVPV
tara:strand:+ start:3179 stop:4912 length:1734 start_codon:yes stop_codon:yes gene_type:complete